MPTHIDICRCTHTHSRGLRFSCYSHLFIIPIFYFNFLPFHGGNLTDSDNVIPRNLTPEVLQALRAVRFIAQHIKDADKDNEVGTQGPQLGRHIRDVLIFVAHFYWRVSSLKILVLDTVWCMVDDGWSPWRLLLFTWPYFWRLERGGLSPAAFIIVYCP